MYLQIFCSLVGKGRGAKKRKASGSENEGEYNPGKKPPKSTPSKVISESVLMFLLVLYQYHCNNMKRINSLTSIVHIVQR